MLTAPSAVASAPSAAGHAAFRAVRHFGSLDGLRALSVIAVIWHHTVGHDPRLPQLFAMGAHGVTLFFAISGFLIVTLLLREQESKGRIDLKAFYIRRALRIFPLYYTVILIYVILVFALERNSGPGREFFANLIFFLTYTSNWFVALEGRTIFYFAWSLAAEEQFYLLWPSIQRYFTPRRALAAMLLFIAALVGLQWWALDAAAGPRPWWQRAIVDFPLAICFGVVLAHLLHHARTFRAVEQLFGWRASSLVWGGVLLATLALSHSTVLIHLAAAAFVASCVCREDHMLAPVLRWRVLAYIGSISYGMYLLHMLVKNVVSRLLGAMQLGSSSFLVFGLTLIGAVVVAGLSFRYFESYFLRRKQRFSTLP